MPLSNAEKNRRKREKQRQARINLLIHDAASSQGSIRIVDADAPDDSILSSIEVAPLEDPEPAPSVPFLGQTVDPSTHSSQLAVAPLPVPPVPRPLRRSPRLHSNSPDAVVDDLTSTVAALAISNDPAAPSLLIDDATQLPKPHNSRCHAHIVPGAEDDEQPLTFPLPSSSPLSAARLTDVIEEEGQDVDIGVVANLHVQSPTCPDPPSLPLAVQPSRLPAPSPALLPAPSPDALLNSSAVPPIRSQSLVTTSRHPPRNHTERGPYGERTDIEPESHHIKTEVDETVQLPPLAPSHSGLRRSNTPSIYDFFRGRSRAKGSSTVSTSSPSPPSQPARVVTLPPQPTPEPPPGEVLSCSPDLEPYLFEEADSTPYRNGSHTPAATIDPLEAEERNTEQVVVALLPPCPPPPPPPQPILANTQQPLPTLNVPEPERQVEGRAGVPPPRMVFDGHSPAAYALFPNYEPGPSLANTEAVLRHIYTFSCSCGVGAPAPPDADDGISIRAMLEDVRQPNGLDLEHGYPLSKPMGDGDFDHARTSFRGLLSDAQRPALSIQASEDELGGLLDQVHIERSYDVDSVIMRLHSLAAFPTDDFWLSFLPPFQSSFSQNLYCTIDDTIEPHKTRNILFGSYDGNRRNVVHLLFPTGPAVNKFSTTALSFELQERLVDDCVMPALRAACPAQVLQQLPHSFAQAKAKASVPQAKVQRDGAGTRSHIRYPIPSRYLGQFWIELYNRCNQHGSGFFSRPVILYQAHGLKDQTSAPSPPRAMQAFYDKFLAHADPEQLDPDALWVDLGFRDVPFIIGPGRQEHTPAPGLTLFYRRSCMSQLTKGATEPDAFTGYQQHAWSQYAFRDLASVELVNQWSPRLHGGRGICQVKAYNSHKEHLYTLDKAYSPFDSSTLPLLCLGPDLMQEWYGKSAGHNSGGAFRGYGALMASFQHQKQQVLDMLADTHCPEPAFYGARRECRVLYSHASRLDLSQVAPSTETTRPLSQSARRRRYRDESPAAGHEQSQPHDSFYVVRTDEFNRLLLTTISRWALALETLSASARPRAGLPDAAFGPGDQIENTYTGQILQRLLAASCSGTQLDRHPWLWKREFQRRPRNNNRGDDPRRYRGVGLGAVSERLGMVWLPDNDFDWEVPRLQLVRRRQIPIPDKLLGSSLRGRSQHVRHSVTLDTVFDKERLAGYEEVTSSLQQGHRRRAAQALARVFLTNLQRIVQLFNREVLHSLQNFASKIPELGKAGAATIFKTDAQSPALQHLEVLSLCDIDALFVHILRRLGRDYAASTFGYDQRTGRRLIALPTPRVAPSRKPATSDSSTATWSKHVAHTLSGYDNTATWATKPFAQLYHKFAREFEALCASSPHTLGQQPELWKQYCQQHAGSLVLATPNSDKSKLVTVQTSQRSADVPAFFQIGYSCPGLDVSPAYAKLGRRVPSRPKMHLHDALARAYNATGLLERQDQWMKESLVTALGQSYKLASSLYDKLQVREQEDHPIDASTLLALNIIGSINFLKGLAQPTDDRLVVSIPKPRAGLLNQQDHAPVSVWSAETNLPLFGIGVLQPLTCRTRTLRKLGLLAPDLDLGLRAVGDWAPYAEGKIGLHRTLHHLSDQIQEFYDSQDRDMAAAQDADQIQASDDDGGSDDSGDEQDNRA